MSQTARILVVSAVSLLLAAAAAAQRQWTVTGQEVPELAEIDRMVQLQMVSYGIRGAEVAIAKDGRLVYARGFTWDAPGVEPVQPTTLFRTGSIAKAITSIAVHQLIEGGLLSYDTPVASTLGLQPLPGHVTDPRLAQVTVDHLLTHTSGLSSVDSVYVIDERVAAAVGAGPPPTKREILSYVVGQPFMFDPGTVWDYNNYGYIMLDQLIEHASGEPYEEYVLNHVFRPVGVGRARVAHQLLSERVPTETTYDGLECAPYNLAIENAAAAGGWVMAAPDMARLFSALFDSSDAEGLLARSTIDSMLSLPFPASVALGYGRGWIQEKMFIDMNHSVEWLIDPDDGLDVYGHGGGGTGIHSLALWRSDGIVFVWFTNKDPIIPRFDFPEIASWPDHDLWQSVGVSLEPVGAAPTEVWVPVVSHASGVGRSEWRSDLGLLNRSTLANRVRLRLADGGTSVAEEIELAPGQSRTLGDVLSRFELDGSFPLRVFSSEPLSVTSRTFTLASEGTYGQLLGGVTPVSGLQTGDEVVLMQLAENESYRSNIGLHNGWKRPADVAITLLDGSSLPVASFVTTVPPESTVQLNRPFWRRGGRADIDSGYAVVSVLFGQHVVAYGSVVDNSSDDPTTIAMKTGPGSVDQWLAAAASTGGAHGSVWRTDLCLLNRSGEVATVEVRYRSDDGRAATGMIVLQGGEQRTWVDVVGNLGSDGSGSLQVFSDRSVLASSRTYTTGDAGTYGQLIDAAPVEDAASAGRVVWLSQLQQNASYRTNLGILNGGDTTARVLIRLYDGEGHELTARQRTIEAMGRLQLQEPFSRIAGRDDIVAGYASVTVNSGAGIVAYASVVDNATNDPTTIPAAR